MVAIERDVGIELDAGRQPRDVGPPEPAVSRRTQGRLLELARAALRVAIGTESALALSLPAERGRWRGRRAAVFVTLTKAGELRGCMGTLQPDRPLGETVALTAITAARDDPRFAPLQADELPLLHVDVSILGPFAELAELSAFVPGVHGVMVERDGRRALLLPEVAIDHRWDGERMLGAVCEKAGLPRDAWQDQRTRRLVFRTVRFGGPAGQVLTGATPSPARRSATRTAWAAPTKESGPSSAARASAARGHGAACRS